MLCIMMHHLFTLLSNWRASFIPEQRKGKTSWKQITLDPFTSLVILMKNTLLLVCVERSCCFGTKWLQSESGFGKLRDGGGRAIPALSLRACPMPGGRSGKSWPAGWAAPPMLLCGRRRPSARAGGGAGARGGGRGGGTGEREQVACRVIETNREQEQKEPRQSNKSALDS